MTHIPLDLVAEILCQLPVKFLVQLRCICKSWNTLISDDSSFVKKHLRVSTTKRKHLLACTWIPQPIPEFSMMSYPLYSPPLTSIFTSEPTLLECCSPIPPDSYNTLVGSCDGILCFAVDKHVVLWNPSIRKLKKLPSLELGVTICAFGYDPFTDTYKVVYLSRYSCESHGIDGIPMKVFKTQVNIFTLGTHSWRRIKDFPSMIPYGISEGIIVSGTVNWFAYSTVSGNCIVSLSLGKECYQEISEPNCDEMPVYLTMGMMRDCLCIFSHSHSLNDVWLMKEYGNKESWIKLIHLPYFGVHDHFPYQKILYISDDDNHVLLVHIEFQKLKWVVYDSKNHTIKSFKIQKDIGWVESNVDVERLISL